MYIKTMRLLIAVLLLTTLGWVDGATVLFFPVPGPKSPLLVLIKVAKELRERGIGVAWLVQDADAPSLAGFSPVITYRSTSIKGFGPVKGSITVAGPKSALHMFSDTMTIFESSCNAVMSNETALTAVKDVKADLLAGFHILPCMAVLASKLDLSYVSISPAPPLDPLLTTPYTNSNRRIFLPIPLSYLPQMGMRATTQHMTYLQRMENFARFWMFHAADYIVIRPRLQAIFKSHGLNLQAPRERRRHVLTLFSADWAVEWVRPLLPNTKMVGPILPEPALALPADLQEFMEGAGENGVLVVAMGTVAILGVKERQAMAAAFAELPVRVLWRLSDSELPDQQALTLLGLGNNTKVVKWMPQNDVLGHPQTRAFLNHCGQNSLYEAAYHGVPVIALPFFGDQPGNADKAVAKGFAVQVKHADLGTHAFAEAILHVLDSPHFAAAAASVSQRMRARPRAPVQEAADWIEHTLATGADPYLRSPEADMSFLRRHNIDVVATYLAAALVSVTLIWRLLARAGDVLLRSVRHAKATKTKKS